MASGLRPFPPAVIDRVVALTLTDPPGETTHWTGRAVAAVLCVVPISLASTLGSHSARILLTLIDRAPDGVTELLAS